MGPSWADSTVRLGLTPLALAVETWSWLRSFRRLRCFYVFGSNKIHDDLSTIFSLCILTIVRWVASHHGSLSELLVVRSFDNHKIQDQVGKTDLHGRKNCSHLASIFKLTVLTKAGMSARSQQITGSMRLWGRGWGGVAMSESEMAPMFRELSVSGKQ